MSEEEIKSKQTFLMTLEEFIQSRLFLLQVENDEEIERNRYMREHMTVSRMVERKLILCRLALTDVRNLPPEGSGNVKATFSALKRATNSPPFEKFSQGDIVGLIDPDASPDILMTGVASSVSENSICIYFNKAKFLDEKAQFHVIKITNEITFKRLKSLLERMVSYTSGPSSALFSLFFSPISSSPIPKNSNGVLILKPVYTPSGLNESQVEAVQFAMTQPHLSVIHGPPGTGKTTTLIELICHLCAQGSKMLVCAPSNVAVDNLVEKLAPHAVVDGKTKSKLVKMVRLGHAARMSPSVVHHGLEQIMARSDGYTVLQAIQKELDELKNQPKFQYEMGRLRKELTVRTKKLEQHCLGWANVVLCTLVTATPEILFNRLPTSSNHFDLVIIDEASQSTEPACWMPLVHVNKCVLFGDPCQLPPTVISKMAADGGLSHTLMDRALGLHGDAIKKTLNTQYRMNQHIMDWPSQQFYEGKLQAHPSVKEALLKDLPNVKETKMTVKPLLFIDTNGQYPEDEYDIEEDSKGNSGEAEIAVNVAKYLVMIGMQASDIGIITPYSEQVRLIRAQGGILDIEVKTVDGFQGREKEAIILSLVRSNIAGEIGFLADEKRLNVAITRARRHLCVIGDINTLKNNPLYMSFIEHMDKKQAITSIHFFLDEYTDTCMKDFHEAAFKAKTASSSQRDTPNDRPESEDSPPKQEKPKESTSKRKDSYRRMHKRVKKTLEKIMSKEGHSYNLSLQQSKDLTSILQKLTKKYDLSLSIIDNKYVITKKSPPKDLQTVQSCPPTHPVFAGSGPTVNMPVGRRPSKEAEDPHSQGDHLFLEGKSAASRLPPTPSAVSLDRSFRPASASSRLQRRFSIRDIIGRSSSSSCSSDSSDEKTSEGEEKSGSSGSDSLTFGASTSEDKQFNSLLPHDFLHPLEMADDSKQLSLSTSSSSEPDEQKSLALPSPYQESVTTPESYSMMVSSLSQISITSTATTTKKKKKKQKNAAASSQLRKPLKSGHLQNDQSDDALLEFAAASVQRCQYRNCEASVRVLGITCEFCRYRYCTQHHLPEVHGCTVEARKAARKEHRALHPPPQPSAMRQNLLKNSLKKKMDEKAAKRKPKKK